MRPELIVAIVVILLLAAVFNYVMCITAGEADEQSEIWRANYEKEKRKNGKEKSDDLPADGGKN